MTSVEQIVELFLNELRSGGRPEVEDYCQRFPELADELRDLLPMVQLFEHASETVCLQRDGEPSGIPQQIGAYNVLRQVGVGGMGVVYEARHRELGRRVALKVLTATLAGDRSHRERFQREIRLASNLHHTNIVPVYETGIHAGIPYFAMQYIMGRSLEHWLVTPEATDESRRFRQAADMVRQVADALHYAHGHAVLHRDIKPSNLLLANDGTVWITDFGLARQGDDGVTRTGDIVGTLRYMAPERFSSAADSRSDIYSLGLTLYELCTLRPAFPEADRVRLYHDIMESRPPRPRSHAPALPRDLETIVLRAIEKEPGQRYQTAADLADDLRLWLDDRPIRSRPVSTLEHGWRWAKRNPLIAWLSLAIALMLVVLVGVFSISSHRRGLVIEELNRANLVAQQRLYDSYVGRAQASRWSGRPGQNYQALEAITGAAQLVDGLYPEPAERETQRLTLRNEAIAAMVLADISPRKHWQVSLDERIAVAFDESFERYVQSDSQGNVVLRRVADEAEQGRIPGDGAPCWELRLSADGRYALGVFHDGPPQLTPAVLRVWDFEANRETLRVENLPLPTILDWHVSTGTLAVADHRHELRLFDFRNGELTQELAANSRPLAICFLADRQLAISRNESLEVEILDVESPSAPQRLMVDDEITALAWCPTTQRLAAGTAAAGEIYLWSLVGSPSESVRLRGHSARVTRLYFTRHGRLLASNSWDSTTRLWDAVGGRELMTIEAIAVVNPGFGFNDRGLAFSGPANRFSLWEVTEGGPLRSLPRVSPDRQARTLAFHPMDDRLLAVATGTGLRFWDCQRSQIVGDIETGLVRTVDFSSDGRSAYLGGERGITKCSIAWHNDGERVRLEVGPIETIDPEPAYRAHLSGNDSRIVAFRQHEAMARVIDAVSGDLICRLGPHPNLDRAVISPDGRWVATSTWSGIGLRVWNATTGQLVQELHSNIGSATIAFSPTGTWLAASDGMRQHLWRVDDWERVHSWLRTEPDGWPGPVAFFPDESLVVLPHNRTTAQLVDLASGNRLAILEAPQRLSLSTYSVSASGRFVAINHAEGIQLWDLHQIRQRLAPLGLDW